MKKSFIFAFIFILSISMCACGRNNAGGTTTPSTIMPSTDMNIIPDTMPTAGTNIPDPNVNTEMPIYTQGTDTTEFESTGRN